MNTELLGFLQTIGINAAVGLVFLLVFGWCKNQQVDLYFKYKDSSFLPPGPFGWMRTVFAVDEAIELRSKPDALSTLWLLSTCFKISVCASCLGLLVCLPLNVCAQWIDENKDAKSGLAMLSASNIKDKDNLLIVHSLCLFAICLAMLYLLTKACHKYAQLRQEILSAATAQNFSVLFRKIDQDSALSQLTSVLLRKPKEQLADPLTFARNFESFCPSQQDGAEQQPLVHAVTLFCDTCELQKLHEEQQQVMLALEHAEGEWQHLKEENPEAADDERPTSRVDGYGCCGGEKVDTIAWSTDDKLPELELQMEQAAAEMRPNGAGVICLKSKTAAAQALNSTELQERTGLELWRAPAANDVCWEAMGHTRSRSKSCAVGLLVVAFCILFMLGVVAIASFANLDSLDKKCNCLGFIVGLPSGIYGLITKFLPVLIMMMLLSWAPGILYTINSKEHLVSHSATAGAFLRSHFNFLFYNLFLVYLFSGSIFNEIDALTKDFPSAVPKVLGQSIPSNAIFFTLYIATLASGLPSRLSLIGPFIVGRLKRKYLTRTTREFTEAMDLPPYDIGKENATFLVVLTMSLTYSVVAPIILPFTMIYFGLAYLVIKQQMLCNTGTGRAVSFWTEIRFDSGAAIFDVSIRLMLFGLTVAMVMNASYFAVRQNYVAIVITLATLPVVAYKWYELSRVLNAASVLDSASNEKTSSVGTKTEEDQEEELKAVFLQQPSEEAADSSAYMTSNKFVTADDEDDLSPGVPQAQTSFYRHPALASRSAAAEYSYVAY